MRAWHIDFGSVGAQHLLRDPDTVIQGNRVLRLRYRVSGSDAGVNP